MKVGVHLNLWPHPLPIVAVSKFGDASATDHHWNRFQLQFALQTQTHQIRRFSLLFGQGEEREERYVNEVREKPNDYQRAVDFKRPFLKINAKQHKTPHTTANNYRTHNEYDDEVLFDNGNWICRV